MCFELSVQNVQDSLIKKRTICRSTFDTTKKIYNKSNLIWLLFFLFLFFSVFLLLCLCYTCYSYHHLHHITIIIIIASFNPGSIFYRIFMSSFLPLRLFTHTSDGWTFPANEKHRLPFTNDAVLWMFLPWMRWCVCAHGSVTIHHWW